MDKARVIEMRISSDFARQTTQEKIRKLTVDFPKSWENFCYNAEQTLSTPGVTVHIFERIADEFKQLLNGWKKNIAALVKRSTLEQRDELNLLTLQLNQIEESFQKKDKRFFNSIRQIIGSPNAEWPEDKNKKKIHLVKK
jgi:hypothetical protein